MQLPRISSNFILAAAIFVVLLFSMADMLMLLSYSGQTTAYLLFLNQKADMMGQAYPNDTYKVQVAGYLAYLDTRINTTSQSYNIALQDSLQEINTLKELNKIMNKTIGNLTIYIIKLNETYQALGMRTADNVTEYYINNTYVPEKNVTQVIEQLSCRQKLINEHGLGPMFDVVYCCESRAYGFADECCACYR